MNKLVAVGVLFSLVWVGIASAAPPDSQRALGKQATLQLVEINKASEAELLRVVGAELTGQILQERKKGRFHDWPDVVHRVVGLSAAQTAFMASIGGLTVNGKSLDGAPPDAAMAAMMNNRRR